MSKFTIITVVKNDVSNIEKTIKSVISQKKISFEYIIFDGKSTDGTSEIIKENIEEIDKYFCENDLGIYDAMNKTLEHIEDSSWVVFMNSGDVFYEENVLFNISKFIELNSNSKIIIGGHNNYKGNIIPKKINNLWKGNFCSHQSTYILGKLFKEYDGYNLEYTYAADFEFLMRAYCSNIDIKTINQICSYIKPGGVSDIRRIDVIKEFHKINLLHRTKNKIYTHFYFILAIFMTKIKLIIKSII